MPLSTDKPPQEGHRLTAARYVDSKVGGIDQLWTVHTGLDSVAVEHEQRDDGKDAPALASRRGAAYPITRPPLAVSAASAGVR
jgi:hypothetical protein